MWQVGWLLTEGTVRFKFLFVHLFDDVFESIQLGDN